MTTLIDTATTKRLLLAALLLAGCASAPPVPLACYELAPIVPTTGSVAYQEAARLDAARYQQFQKAHCAGRFDGGRVTVSESEVPRTRFRYVEPNYRGGLGGLEPY